MSATIKRNINFFYNISKSTILYMRELNNGHFGIVFLGKCRDPGGPHPWPKRAPQGEPDGDPEGEPVTPADGAIAW